MSELSVVPEQEITVGALPLLLTTAETARVLRIDRNQVTRNCRKARLAAEKIGRDWRVFTLPLVLLFGADVIAAALAQQPEQQEAA